MGMEVLLLVIMPLGTAALSYLLGRYVIRAAIFAFWASIVVFAVYLFASASMAEGEYAGMGQYLILMFVVAPGMVVSLIAGNIGLTKARQARTV